MKLDAATLVFDAVLAFTAVAFCLYVLAITWIFAPTVHVERFDWEPVDMDSVASFQEADPDYSYPVMGYAVYSQGTILAGHGWSR